VPELIVISGWAAIALAVLTMIGGAVIVSVVLCFGLLPFLRPSRGELLDEEIRFYGKKNDHH